ncbi:unnamed protein product [Rotaria socialis]|uniref:Uncharacterized protein n=1 Tax=Rotaria socialis TaxID=392032 RepID=A0A821UBP4_9BILA|nr:unnamed protein product [Rotaria socialis]CAF4887476.1 unnamed protein product [Rotaria socialis]
MLFRSSNLRIFGILALVATIVYALFGRWLLASKSFYNINYKIDSSSSSILRIMQSQHIPSIFIDTPMREELARLSYDFIRVSPTELNQPLSTREYKAEILPYDENKFRQSSTPILWLDKQKDVRWNQAAERAMIDYLTQKQFPNYNRIANSSLNKPEVLKTCSSRSLFALHQHWSGFFSRVLCFIAQFGQTLYTPRIAVFRGSRFSSSHGDVDDFLAQGVKRFFLPMSICTAYEYHPEMAELKKRIEDSPNQILIRTSKELHNNRNNKEDRALFSLEFWKLDYHHVPIRKWLFDRKKTSVSYDSPIHILADHSDEHIYAPNNEKNVSLGEWIDRNKPDAFSSDLLPNAGQYKLTWTDYVFGSFLRYMFTLFFGSQNAPRIEYGVKLVTEHWLSYLTDKYSIPAKTNVFDRLAGLYIRRGDKSPEDSFWRQHKHWRNLSLYVKGIVDEERRRDTTYQYIFVMSDDSSVVSTLQDYTNPRSQGTDEPYARKHLRGREILYNVLAPQACFDPFVRIGFDQFLVSLRFLIQHSALTIGHIDSNVFRFLREVKYAQQQQRIGVQTYTYTLDAPNSLDDKP